MDRVPPPVVHLHIRCFDVAREIPIGDLPRNDLDSNRNVLQQVDSNLDVSEVGHLKFDKWLRDLWTLKDEMIDAYHSKGSLVSDAADSIISLPLRLRNSYDYLDAFCFFCPGIAIFLIKQCIDYFIN